MQWTAYYVVNAKKTILMSISHTFAKIQVAFSWHDKIELGGVGSVTRWSVNDTITYALMQCLLIPRNLREKSLSDTQNRKSIYVAIWYFCFFVKETRLRQKSRKGLKIWLRCNTSGHKTVKVSSSQHDASTFSQGNTVTVKCRKRLKIWLCCNTSGQKTVRVKASASQYDASVFSQGNTVTAKNAVES